VRVRAGPKCPHEETSARKLRRVTVVIDRAKPKENHEPCMSTQPLLSSGLADPHPTLARGSPALGGPESRDKTIAVRREHKGNIEGHGVVEGLLHSVADAVVIVLRDNASSRPSPRVLNLEQMSRSLSSFLFTSLLFKKLAQRVWLKRCRDSYAN
jgi:hypothetical protein